MATAIAGVHIRIALGVCMTLWAVGLAGVLGCRCLSAKNVCPHGNRFQVLDIDAPAMETPITARACVVVIVAYMVNRESIGNRTHLLLIYEAMHQGARSPVVLTSGISLRVTIARPRYAFLTW